VIVSLIFAMDEKGGIGIANHLPWHLSADLKRFKALTMGHHIIMGRKTYESIGKPLPGRTNLVVTRDPSYQAAGCLVAHSLDEALQTAEERGEDEVFITGGRQIFAQSISIADRIYLTQVHAEVRADVYFPEFNTAEWVEQEAVYHESDEKNDYPFTAKVLVRKSGGDVMRKT
jgi:dihydrofolate reductase